MAFHKTETELGPLFRQAEVVVVEPGRLPDGSINSDDQISDPVGRGIGRGQFVRLALLCAGAGLVAWWLGDPNNRSLTKSVIGSSTVDNANDGTDLMSKVELVVGARQESFVVDMPDVTVDVPVTPGMEVDLGQVDLAVKELLTAPFNTIDLTEDGFVAQLEWLKQVAPKPIADFTDRLVSETMLKMTDPKQAMVAARMGEVAVMMNPNYRQAVEKVIDYLLSQWIGPQPESQIQQVNGPEGEQAMIMPGLQDYWQIQGNLADEPVQVGQPVWGSLPAEAGSGSNGSDTGNQDPDRGRIKPVPPGWGMNLFFDYLINTHKESTQLEQVGQGMYMVTHISPAIDQLPGWLRAMVSQVPGTGKIDWVRYQKAGASDNKLSLWSVSFPGLEVGDVIEIKTLGETIVRKVRGW